MKEKEKKEKIEKIEITNQELAKKINILTIIMVIGFVAVIGLNIGLYFVSGKSDVTELNQYSNSDDDTQDTVAYDVSKMHEVTLDEAIGLYNSQGTYLLYIGRADCSACQGTVPTLNQVQEELNYTTQYLDLNKITANYSSWKEAMKAMDPLVKKFSQTDTVNGEKGKIGELFEKYGYTPTFAIIKDGKVVDSFIGGLSADSLKAKLTPYL